MGVPVCTDADQQLQAGSPGASADPPVTGVSPGMLSAEEEEDAGSQGDCSPSSSALAAICVYACHCPALAINECKRRQQTRLANKINTFPPKP